MAMKTRIGKLADPAGAIPRLSAVLAERGMTELAISIAHAVEAGRMGGEHRDPFDRILIAQSRLEGLPIVTNDPVFADHGVRVIW
jgi:PIN domain nuclease of toxin-antitoxin system